MKLNRNHTGRGLALVILALLLTLNYQLSTVFAQGTAFTYQGRLNDGANPASGIYDLRFTLYDACTGGSPVAGPLTNSPTAVSNGLFTVRLDFGGVVFNGADRWLEIGVRTNGGGAFSQLNPRQEITPTPYAVYAAEAGIAASAIGVAANSVGSFALQSSSVTSAKIADGTILATDVNAASFSGTFWKVDGNAGTVPGLQFLGTSDNKPLELRVNNQRVLRLDYSSGSPNILGGHPGNTIGAGASGVTIAGGGEDSVFGSLYYNSANSTNGTIGGGAGIYIGTNSSASTIAGGLRDSIADGAYESTIGGGSGNGISADAYHSVIAGGRVNGVGERAVVSTIGGGLQNSIDQTNWAVTISGGQNNRVGTQSRYSAISGGYLNSIGSADLAISYWDVIGGGYNNQIYGAAGAVISGGYQNWLLNAPYANIGGGTANLIDGAPYATVSGGSENIIQTNAVYATIPGGSSVIARSYGQLAYSAGSFGFTPRGDSQSSLYVLRGVTTNAALTELFLEGADALSVSNRMMVPLFGVWTFDILVVATTAYSTQVAGYQIKGMVANQGGPTVLLGTTVTPLYEDVGAWDANVVADAAHGALGIIVKGSNGATIRWVASVRTIEVISQ